MTSRKTTPEEQDEMFRSWAKTNMIIGKRIAELEYRAWARKHCAKCGSNELNIVYSNELDMLLYTCRTCKREWQQEPIHKNPQ